MGLDQYFFATPQGLETPWGFEPKEEVLYFRKFWPLVGHFGCEYGYGSGDGANLPTEAIEELAAWAANPSAAYPDNPSGHWYDKPESIDEQMAKIAAAVPKMLELKTQGLDIWYVESH